MAYRFQVTVDAQDPHALAAWWAAALGWEVQVQDETQIRRMIAEGQASESDTVTVAGRLAWRDGAAIEHPDGTATAPRLYFQEVSEPKTAKNRVHLDLHIGGDSLSDVTGRLRDAGATFVHDGRQGPHVWVTLADPEGNEFCVAP